MTLLRLTVFNITQNELWMLPYELSISLVSVIQPTGLIHG